MVQSKGGGPVFGLPSVHGLGNLSVLGGRDVGTSWRYGNQVRGEVNGGGCIISLFLTLVSKQKTLSFVLLKIQDYFEQRKQIKNGHHNILLISFKKLIRLQRHSTERVHGPLPWMDAENPHVNQLVIAESV